MCISPPERADIINSIWMVTSEHRQGQLAPCISNVTVLDHIFGKLQTRVQTRRVKKSTEEKSGES